MGTNTIKNLVIENNLDENVNNRAGDGKILVKMNFTDSPGNCNAELLRELFLQSAAEIALKEYLKQTEQQ